MAEYFDASEVIVCETSSEAEASDESGLSDITTTSNSEPDEGHGKYWHKVHMFFFFINVQISVKYNLMLIILILVHSYCYS